MNKDLFQNDYHIHTVYSGHSHPEMTPENIIILASSKKLKDILILEHIPTIIVKRKKGGGANWSVGDLTRDHIDGIVAEVEMIKPRYPELRIFTGMEIDANSITCDGSLLWNDLSGVDFIVASLHSFPGSKKLWFENVYMTSKEKEECIEKYFEWVALVVANPKVDILAHPGVFLGSQELITSFDSSVLKKFEPMMENCKKYNVALELNELVFRKISMAISKTYYKLIALALEVGVKISMATDAHRPDKIGSYLGCCDIAEKINLKYDDLFIP